MTTNERAYHALVLKAMCLGQPKCYHDDLYYHDRVALGVRRIPEAPYGWEVKEDTEFLWIVRDCGTDLVGQNTDGQVWNLGTLDYYRKGGFGHDNVSCWWWDGERLAPIAMEDAHERLLLAQYHADRPKGHSLACKVA